MFKVSAKLEYGLRAMILLAEDYQKKKLSLSQMSEKEAISREFLAQLMLNLKKANLVESYKGISGGFILAKSPSDITLREIIEALEGPIKLIECIHVNDTCTKQNFCQSQKVWDFIESKILKLLEDINLEDLTKGTLRKEEVLSL
ncbi:MAG TPA: Rrf2 family transcriptional regulator [Dictyoglomaceae bacterium]|nr:Rrf2 family transcriptional regulator [Dictyoglomaceae bacterium]HOL39194.1 Rrf2 family transcriptional regulator [Dictyoglomaceae bacterium]